MLRVASPMKNRLFNFKYKYNEIKTHILRYTEITTFDMFRLIVSVP